jgi:hypothetical protein
MAVTVSTVSTPLGTKLVLDTATDTNSNAAEDNVVAGATNVYYVEIDNKNNSAATYVKLSNSTDATPNSTTPDHVFYAPGGVKVSYVIETGIVFNTGLSFWGTSTAGSATTQTDPSESVTTKILCG